MAPFSRRPNLACNVPGAGAKLDGEEKAKLMANRLEFSPDQVLSPAQLTEVRQNFAKLSLPRLQTAYTEALERGASRIEKGGTGLDSHSDRASGSLRNIQ